MVEYIIDKQIYVRYNKENKRSNGGIRMKYLYNKLVICFAFGAVLLSGMLTITIAASKEPFYSDKNVTSVYIEKGDSLWTIAEKFYTEENVSMKEYIDEIKKCNHLAENEIKEGQYLIVPYYVSE